MTTQVPASKHLRVLSDAGIVGVEPSARRRIYHLRSEPFAQMDRWVGSFEPVWKARLDSLGRYLESTDTNENDDP